MATWQAIALGVLIPCTPSLLIFAWCMWRAPLLEAGDDA